MDVLIGEAVVLEARPASFATRALGALLDAAMLAAALFAVLIIGANTWDGFMGDDRWLPAIALLVVVTLFVVVPVTIETLSRGRSLGKWAAGIRVVRDDGGPVRLRHALIRALVGVLELWLTMGSIALISSLANTKGKRLGDVVAGTYAIRVRGARTSDVRLETPEPLVGWVRAADLRRLPDGLALAIRQFLARSATLAPASREQLGRDLALALAPYVAPAPPVGTPVEAFLMAVLAERRDRDLVRARRDQQLVVDYAAQVRQLPFAIAD